MSFSPNEKIEVDPNATAPAPAPAPARVASPVLGSTTAAAAGIKTGNPYYDVSASRNEHLGTGAGIMGTGAGVRGNSIEHAREVDAYPQDHKVHPDSITKNDIEADVQNGDRLTDSDVGDQVREPNMFQKFYIAHRAVITIAIHVIIGAVMTG